MSGPQVLVKLMNCRREREYFTIATSDYIKVDDLCVVDRGFGKELGTVLADPESANSNSDVNNSHKVLRKGKEADKQKNKQLQQQSGEVLKRAKSITERHQLPMKLIEAEFTLDKETLFLYFTSPRRVDFRGLTRELATAFDARIELRHLSPREEAQIKGGLGRCGNPLCCSEFLDDPKSISISLVHDQELFVSPDRVTGICGRLFCCLQYEHQNYVEIISEMPRIGARIRYRGGEYEVVGHNIFDKSVTLEGKDGKRIEVPYRDIKEE